VAVIALLLAILLPSLARARLTAKVVKVHAELRGICNAVDAYYTEWNAYPLAQSYCAGETHSMGQYFELPAELFDSAYLSGRRKSAGVHDYFRYRDPFDPNGHSYKYIRPGVGWGNHHKLTKHRIWVPSGFPSDTGEDICYPTYKLNPDPDAPPHERWIVDKNSPVAYAVWSCGPRGPIGWFAFQESQGIDGSHLPVPSRNWHRPGQNGILCHLTTSKYSSVGEGHHFTSP
jgi:type II secretory pathway pseudopilin PulG